MNFTRSCVSAALLTGAFVIPAAACRSSLTAAPPPSAAPPATPPTLRALYGLHAPTSFDADRTALVLIDFQEEFFSGRLPIPDGARAVDRAAELLRWARRTGISVVHVRNVARAESPLFAAGSPTVAPVAVLSARDGETVVIKSMAGAFSKTDLDATLRARRVDTLVLAGIMTHLAVDTSARDATVLGYKVVVASDATATRDLPGIDHATLQRASLAALSDRFADVMTTEAVLAVPVGSDARPR